MMPLSTASKVSKQCRERPSFRIFKDLTSISYDPDESLRQGEC